MVPETFTDGIGWIGLSEGMIRIEFMTIPPAAEADGRKPEPEVRHRIIMTPQAFLRSVIAQQRLIAKLQNASVAKLPLAVERSGADRSADNGTVGDAIVGSPRSPNFPSD
jgi:hypothetical protein